MSWKFFLDDERNPPGNDPWEWNVIRSYEDFKTSVLMIFSFQNKISYISFDHDLGERKNGHDCAKFLIDFDMDHGILSEDFEFYVHSQNPVGAENIRCLMNNYLSHKEK